MIGTSLKPSIFIKEIVNKQLPCAKSCFFFTKTYFFQEMKLFHTNERTNILMIKDFH